METISVTYLGMPVCADAQLAESDDQGARISTQQPMPVGTDLEIAIGETVRHARVTSVTEVRDPAMRVTYFEPGHTPVPRAETGDKAEDRAPESPGEPAETKPKRRRKKP